MSDSLVRFVRRHKNWLSHPNQELAFAFEQLVGDLARARLINASLRADVSNMIKQNVLNGVPHQESPSNATVNGINAGPTASETMHRIPGVTIPQSNPAAALQAWKQHVGAQLSDHCGMCTKPVRKSPKDGMQCSAPDCETPIATFHICCVKLKRRHLDWVCPGCRLRTKLKGEALDRKVRDKGKQRVLDRY